MNIFLFSLDAFAQLYGMQHSEHALWKPIKCWAKNSCEAQSWAPKGARSALSRILPLPTHTSPPDRKITPAIFFPPGPFQGINWFTCWNLNKMQLCSYFVVIEDQWVLAARARPCAARTRLFGFINMPNGALRAPPPPHPRPGGPPKKKKINKKKTQPNGRQTGPPGGGVLKGG